MEQLLMQVVLNSTGTAAEVAGDAFLNSINSLLGSATALVIAVAGIVTAIIAARSNGRTKTKQEEQAIATAEAVQVTMQKIAETMAQQRQVGKAVLTLATTDEQRKVLDEKVAPVVNNTSEQIKVIHQQIPAIKEIIGVKTADANKLEMPRESSTTLASINKAVDEAKAGA